MPDFRGSTGSQGSDMGGYILLYSRQRGDTAPWNDWDSFMPAVENAMLTCDDEGRITAISAQFQ